MSCGLINKFKDLNIECSFAEIPTEREIENFLQKAQTTFPSAGILDEETQTKFIKSIQKLEADRGSLAVAWNLMERLPNIQDKFFSTTLITAITLAAQDRDDTSFPIFDCAKIFICQEENGYRPERQELAAVSLQMKSLINSFEELGFFISPIQEAARNKIMKTYIENVLQQPFLKEESKQKMPSAKK